MLTPRPYQIVGRDFLASRTRALLADEMRVGKTPQAILAAKHINADKVLVLCPAIAVPHWRREWGRWWGVTSPAVDVLSYDKARIAWEYRHLQGRRWDVMIVDECHFAKNPEAKRTKMVYGGNGLGWQADRVWSLSGTPAPKHAGELWPMLRAFGVVGMTYDEFLRRYCYFNYAVDPNRPLGTRADRIRELKALLAKVMLRRTRKEVAPEMPEIGFDFLEVEPTTAADLGGIPQASDNELLEWLERNAAREDRQAVAMAKVASLADEIEFAIKNGLLKQTVVFGWHKAPLVKLAYELESRGLRFGVITGDTPGTVRQKVQAAFRAGDLDGVCANILAAGTAIDLSAASHGYFLELHWVGSDNLQAANRLVSMDKKEPVTFDVVTWPGSTDDRVQRVLMRRMKEIKALGLA